LLSEERDAEISAGDFELRIGDEGLFEELLRVGGALLIHVGDAESVETVGFGGVDVRSRFLRGRSG
jgi:hypothetical protein